MIHKDDRFTMARSLLVFRNGKLIAEAYPHDPEEINHIYNIQSCTKSVTSVMVGVAIKKNDLADLQEKLFDISPQYFDDDVTKRSMTIEDVLTMRTCLEYDNGTQTLNLYQTEENSVKFILSQKKIYNPGTIINYHDGAPQLVSKVI